MSIDIINKLTKIHCILFQRTDLFFLTVITSMKTNTNKAIFIWDNVDCNKQLPELTLYNNSIIAHAFWYSFIEKKQIFSIKSFLCTQKFDLFEIFLSLYSASFNEKQDKINSNILILKSRYDSVFHFVDDWNVMKEIIGKLPTENISAPENTIKYSNRSLNYKY